MRENNTTHDLELEHSVRSEDLEALSCMVPRVRAIRTEKFGTSNGMEPYASIGEGYLVYLLWQLRPVIMHESPQIEVSILQLTCAKGQAELQDSQTNVVRLFVGMRCWRSINSPSEIVQETTEKIIQVKQRMQAARDRQKSYADLKRKPMEFEVGDKVMLKVSPWKGVVRFGKRGKLNPRFVGPFKVIKRVGDVAYKLELPEELSRVHNTFHVSNLKKCHADEPLAVPLDGLHFDDKLQFVEEPIEITDREVKRLKRSRIPLVKVRWNSKRGPEFTWEREDQFRKKYPHLFTKTAPSSSAV
ncbi:hypothetical protein Tco_1172405 [Tanacetum coccineum]